ncbi:DUF1835 domain-containing protein [Kurthia huakuii]|uniref:DUF1835 domain-containing protein n=1 Tax=Kurthia huakuii TaxID=1421019 RepID=UPI000497A6F0|nr:DUF1835 domain-containing protein [Kurthia huakuii]MBM7699291.1 hypothetical protein [Kurthia huakuii]
MEKSDLMKQKIDELSENQAKNLLLDLYTELDANDESWFTEQLKHQLEWDTSTVHIVFGRTAALSLKQAIDERVIAFPDVLSMGPIKAIDTWKGMEARYAWFKLHLTDTYNEFKKMKRNMMQSFRDLKRLTAEQDVVIWTCANSAEQIGLRIVMAALPIVQSIGVIDTYQGYRDIEQHDTPGFPRTTGEVVPELLTKIAQLELAMLSDEVIATLKEEGQRWLTSEALLHLFEAGELTAFDETILDDFILEHVERLQVDGYVKAAELLGEVYSTMKDYTGDNFLEYRVRALIAQQQLLYQGDLHDMMLYDIKLAAEPSDDDVDKLL